MSGLAEILLEEGFSVSGSDTKKSPLTEHLEQKGAVIYYGQKAENLADHPDLVVYTSAIHPDNPEYAAMKQLAIPSLTRAELLGQMMRNYKLPVAISGTHGKTTTTSMVSEILLAADADPTLSIEASCIPSEATLRSELPTILLRKPVSIPTAFSAFSQRSGSS